MSSSQPSLVSSANENEVLKPSNDNQWQLFRDRQAPGSGVYSAMNKDGVVEPIGGSGSLFNDIWSPFAEIVALPSGPDGAIYAPFSPQNVPGPSEDLISYCWVCDKTIRISKLSVKVQDGGGADEDIIVEVLKNGAPTGLTVTIPQAGATQIITDLVNSFTMVLNDKISFKINSAQVAGGSWNVSYITVVVEEVIDAP